MALGNRLVLNPLKPLIKKLPKGVQNRYWLLLLIFLLWLAIFDKANLWTQLRLQRSVTRLENDKIYYQNKLKEVQQEKADIESNKEKFAREHYFMKAADEDVFIIDKK